MIQFYFDPTPNSAKVGLFLEEAGLPYEAIPVVTGGGEQHEPSFLAVNPNGKAPAIVDTDRPDGREARVFGATAILIYLAEKTGMFMGAPDDRPELLSWLLYIPSVQGAFSGKAPHFQFAAPVGLDYALNRGWREAERDYQVLNDHLQGRRFVVGETYTIADMSAWCWLDRVLREIRGTEDPLSEFPSLRRLFNDVDSRPAAVRAREIGTDQLFKQVNDGSTKGALPVQLPARRVNPSAGAIEMLKNYDDFPPLTFPCAGGGEIDLPGDLAGGFGVILFYRGAWSPACNPQLAAFSRAADKFAGEGIKIVAVSVDDREATDALVEEYKLVFPVAYAADARAVSAVTGALVNEDALFLEATGFVIDPEGRIVTIASSSSEAADDRIVTASYSPDAVGRLMPDDVLRLVRHLRFSPVGDRRG